MSQNKVNIMTLVTTPDKSGVSEPCAFVVKQRGMQHGYIKVKNYDSVQLAWEAAMTLSDSLEKCPWVSPFETHRSVIFDYYGTAAKLRRVVMGLWNGNAHPFDLSDVAGMDDDHYGIMLELINSYRKYGENDRVFMSLAQEIRTSEQFSTKTLAYIAG
ncbi:MAG: hypothetical protein HZB95_03745 [Nitrosomonadales bacterium]|nr:hypothetical protein [Nitrosomonadales bacterium]